VTERGVLRMWYAPGWRWAAWLLAPLAVLFGLATALRRFAYRLGLLRSERLPVPVVVIGNLTVGGSGKTPLTIWLARALSERGIRVGILSRGYGGIASGPMLVTADSQASVCGDEPVLLAQQAAVPVAIARRRADAGRLLLQRQDLQLLLCDDGLQHYALARDLEIAVIDGRRGFGNGWLLPAGPLREGVRRLRRVDVIVINGAGGEAVALPLDKTRHVMHIRLTGLRALRDPVGELTDLASWRGRPVHAAAAIGNPSQFFEMLRAAGLEVIEHAAPDHHAWQAAELQFDNDLPVLMTAKDAVKCRRFAQPHWYSVETEAFLPDEAAQSLLNLLSGLAPQQPLR
jgi:tetraacyldisaccharide 4'-kinase